jgi:hypothetical protein
LKKFLFNYPQQSEMRHPSSCPPLPPQAAGAVGEGIVETWGFAIKREPLRGIQFVVVYYSVGVFFS